MMITEDNIFDWLLGIDLYYSGIRDYIEFSSTQKILNLWESGKIYGSLPKPYKLYQNSNDKKIRDSAPYAIVPSNREDSKCVVCGEYTNNHYKELPCGKYALICTICEDYHKKTIFSDILKKYRPEKKEQGKRAMSVTIDARRIPIISPKYTPPDIHIVDMRITPKMSCCKILKKHHDALKEDGERLTTEFIKKLSKCSCDEEFL